MVRIMMVIAMAWMAGCSSFHHCVQPERPPLPEQFAAAPRVSDLKITPTLLDLVNDDQAKALVDEALENNQDLGATALRLESSGLLLSQTQSARVPGLDIGYRATRDNQSFDRAIQRSHQVSLSVSWELDLWGKLADRHRARQLDVEAGRLEYLQAMDSLAARVLQAYIRSRANRLNLGIHEKRVGIYERIEATVLAKYRAGLGSLQDISASRSRTHLARSDRTLAMDVFKGSVRDLELLLGRYPGASLEVAGNLPPVALSSPRTPASVLAKRPDVRAAVKKAEAALSNAKAGHKELLPSVTLTGNLFRDNALLGGLGASDNAWTMAGRLLFPLFNAGRIVDEANAADASARAAYRDLAGVVLRAMREVENAFSKEMYLKKRLDFLEKAMADARQSSTWYEARFKEGMVSIIELHTARDQELTVLSGLLDVKASRLLNRVDMALAMGTGVFERTEHESI